MPKYEITAPGREVIEQLNLQIPVEFGEARQAAIACFHAVDNGENAKTTIVVESGESSLTVSVRKGNYVHGA